MQSPNSIEITLSSSGDIVKARDASLIMATQAGFEKIEASKLVNAVSEIATNAVIHGKGGVARFRMLKGGKILETVIEDKGPGIASVKDALAGKYKPRGLGIGLQAARRAVDEFKIVSKVGSGTTVTMLKYLPIPFEEIEYGIVSFSKIGERNNGDQYLIREYDGDSVLLAIIDGEGHGDIAHEAGILAKDIVSEHYKKPLEDIMMRIHNALMLGRGRGAVVGLCRLNQKLEYLGIGDTEVMVYSDSEIHPFSRPGELGSTHTSLNLKSSMERHKSQIYDTPKELVIVLYSDGIMGRFGQQDLPLHDSAQHIADFIMKNFRRDGDDSTVLVAKKKK